MSSGTGISLDAWVTIDDSCDARCYVGGDQAHFEFGTVEGMLHILTDVDGLAMLARVATQTHATWQAVLEQEPVGFTVTKDGAVEHEASLQDDVQAPTESPDHLVAVSP